MLEYWYIERGLLTDALNSELLRFLLQAKKNFHMAFEDHETSQLIPKGNS